MRKTEDDKIATPDSERPERVRRGPPNRMNDLNYTDWMKFQKSFFRHTSLQSLVEECVLFFTKSVWPDGRTSRVFLGGFDDISVEALSSTRDIDTGTGLESIDGITQALRTASSVGGPRDFVLVDLRDHIHTRNDIAAFIHGHADPFFAALRNLLIPGRYCGVIVRPEHGDGSGFPIPWSVAISSRHHLKLRDEKIALNEADGSVYYCLFMEAADDALQSSDLDPDILSVIDPGRIIPSWVIPKPPPRKRTEILHPAKYPETLVSQFIEMFSEEGDNVLDPMVGTGSTVVAALRSGRNGFGVDLVNDYVEIARERVARERQPSLFPDLEPRVNSMLVQGDATRLDALPDLDSYVFHYAVTSPPYWSMLTNPGSENQAARRRKDLPLVYSDDERDLGNVEDYGRFLELLTSVYDQVASKLDDGAFLTVVVKNVKRNHVIYPLAWDLVNRLAGPNGSYDYAGVTLWCQDDVGLKPFAVGIHWVSNIVHHYCLHFRRRGGAVPAT